MGNKEGRTKTSDELSNQIWPNLRREEGLEIATDEDNLGKIDKLDCRFLAVRTVQSIAGVVRPKMERFQYSAAKPRLGGQRRLHALKRTKERGVKMKREETDPMA
ncbi:Uncharacterized protein HZ326_9515 [Fusarium oxysporum f. sp. albedinis]|nr:Uncharacterized protein HZ326_9515 [Fusarium oxysporum f. sp. albedinis]